MGLLDPPGLSPSAADKAYIGARCYGLPSVTGWYDASTLTQANGATLNLWPDASGHDQDLIQAVVAAPTVKTNALSGKRSVLFAPASRLRCSTFAAGWPQPAGWAQPNTMIAVMKGASSGVGTQAVVVSGGTGTISVLISGSTGIPALNAGSSGAGGGASLFDDTFHVVVATFDTSAGTVMVDGYVVGTATTQTHGAQSLINLYVGSDSGGASAFSGEIAGLILLNARLTPK